VPPEPGAAVEAGEVLFVPSLRSRVVAFSLLTAARRSRLPFGESRPPVGAGAAIAVTEPAPSRKPTKEAYRRACERPGKH
jgi:hypothetical protein